VTAKAQRERQPKRGAAPSAAPSRERWLLVPLLVVAGVLAALIDDRHAGEVADGRQMIRTAVAVVESGTIGQARDTDFTLPRAAGDAVSRFGMGASLLQVPAAWLAPTIEGRLGPASSQFLFLLAPLAAVLAAAWAAGRIVIQLGGTRSAAGWAVLLASLGSPLASYAAMEFSEPMQAASLTGALALALAAARAESAQARRRLSAAAGAAAGFAVLTKTSLLIVAPWALLPLLAAGPAAQRRRALVAAAAGAAPMLALWAAFDLVRFGRLLGGYPDDRFTNPVLDGAWRLLVGPNRGLVVFFPATVLAVTWAVGAIRRREPVPALAAAGALGATVVLVGLSAGYWGWHGMEGWGPRLLVPALPALAALAALWLAGRRSALVGWAVVAVSIMLNLPPLLQHPTPVATYVMNCRWPEVPPGRASDFPFYARGETDAGQPTVVPFAVLESEPAASGLVVYPWLLAANWQGEGVLAHRLAAPPWRRSRPDIVPPAALLQPGTIRGLVTLPRIGFLGRSLAGGGAAAGYASVYADALRDQVVRAQQLGEKVPALALARKAVRVAPGADSDVVLLESLRLCGLRDEAGSYLRSMPMAHRRDPRVNVVLALFERDAGNADGAATMLRTVAEAFPGLPAGRAPSQPLAAWPQTLHAMTTLPRRDAQVAAPGRR
jgi:hypothetical protein